jgi:hypothetical protein
MMQASRRGLMGFLGTGLGAVAMGAGKVRAAIPPAPNTPGMLDGPVPSFTSEGGADPDRAAWKTFNKMVRKERDAEWKNRYIMHRLGGYPPHLASMQSNAPWFRAAKAAEWEMKRRRESESLENKIRRSLGLPLYDE